MNCFDGHAAEYDAWFYENDKLFDSEYDALNCLLESGVEYTEVGVGTGIFAQRLGIRRGVEPCESMARFAKERGIEVVSASAQNLPFADGEAQGLVMITVDCFVKDLSEVFREAHRALKDGGSYVVAFIDAGTPLGKRYEEFKEDSVYYKGAVFRSFDEISDLLSEAGFSVIRCVQTVFTLDNVAQHVRENHGEGVFAVIKAEKEIEKC